jgi:hypothetical protein
MIITIYFDVDESDWIGQDERTMSIDDWIVQDERTMSIDPNVDLIPQEQGTLRNSIQFNELPACIYITYYYTYTV